ncbi:MAG: ATP synthase F1 subunit delta [Verrucomicrobiia bacterium]|jgi:F-type H+-transporting ATPase subunit delta
MPHDPIDIGYAHALFEMAQPEGVAPRVEEELFRLRELLKKNTDLLEFLKDPNIQHEGKRKALTDLFQGRVHPLVLNMLITLSDQDRAGRVLHVIEEFSARVASATEKISGEVTTVVPIDNATLQRLAAELSRITGKSVQLFQKVDPLILGGAIIKVGDQIIDGSLRRRLDQIKERLAQ